MTPDGDTRATSPLVHLRTRLQGLPQPSVALTLAIVALVCLITAVTAFLALGAVTIYAGLAALYIAMGIFGGTLRSDLEIGLLHATGLALFVAVPALVVPHSSLIAGLLLISAIGICGILPALGRTYGIVRLGIGLTAVYAYGYQVTRGVDAYSIIAASYAALVVVIVVRLLAAIPDPDRVLRTAIARVLESGDRQDLESAGATWLRGPSRVWSREVLVGAIRYRASIWAIQRCLELDHEPRRARIATLLTELDRLATEVAAQIRVRRPNPSIVDGTTSELSVLRIETAALHPHDRRVASVAIDGLLHAAANLSPRPRRRAPGAASARFAMVRAALRAGLSPSSDHSRTAARTMITVAAALLIVRFFGRPEFALPLLMGAYSVVQPTFTSSLAEARRRALGVIVGAVVATAIVAAVSSTVATVLAVVALVVAFSYITTSISVFMGGLVVTLTVTIAPVIHVDPQTYALGYAVAVIVGAALATTVGFLLVRPRRPDQRRRDLSAATGATAAALASLTRETANRDQLTPFIAAFRAQQNMTAAETSSNSWEMQASAGLSGLNMLGIAVALDVAARSPALLATLATLDAELRRSALAPLAGGLPEDPDSSTDPAALLLRIEYERLRKASLEAETTQ